MKSAFRQTQLLERVAPLLPSDRQFLSRRAEAIVQRAPLTLPRADLLLQADQTFEFITRKRFPHIDCSGTAIEVMRDVFDRLDRIDYLRAGERVGNGSDVGGNLRMIGLVTVTRRVRGLMRRARDDRLRDRSEIRFRSRQPLPRFAGLSQACFVFAQLFMERREAVADLLFEVHLQRQRQSAADRAEQRVRRSTEDARREPGDDSQQRQHDPADSLVDEEVHRFTGRG